MNKFQLRFTLSNDYLGNLVIKNAIGWDTVPLSLERHKDYWGVLENFSDTLTAYHEAVDYLQAAKDLGIDTQVTCAVEVSEDYGNTWEYFVDQPALVDMESLMKLDSPTGYKTQLLLKKNDVWTMFLKAKDSPTDVVSTEDINGNSVAPADIQIIELTAQPVKKQMRVQMYVATDDDFTDQIFPFAVHPVADGFTIDLPKVVYDEIETKHNYPNGVSEEEPPLPIIEAKEPATDYTIEAALVMSNGGAYNTKLPTGGGGLVVKLQHRTSVPPYAINYPFTRADSGTNGIDGKTTYSLSQVITDVKKGDSFTISIQNFTATTTFDAYIIPDDFYVGFQSYIDIIANTLPLPPVANSKISAIRLFDVADAIIKRTTGGDNFESAFFDVGGCGYDFVNCKGTHVRGKSFSDSAFAPTIEKWFKDADAIFNLGLGFEGGKIIIEEKAHFMDSSVNSINLSNVMNITEGVQKGIVVNSIDIGYNKSSISSGGSLLNDPQTRHKYTSPAKLVGRVITIVSEWIAASSVFELTRRAEVKPNESFDTDEDIFILKVEDGDVHGELKPDTNSTAESDLDNADFIYNKTITPGRNLLRWLNVINVGLTQYIGGVFKFVSGVGNILCSITITTDACNTEATVVENDNVEITADVISGLDTVEFSHPLTWAQYKLIRDSKLKSIGVSKTNADHVPYFIQKIDFYLFKGQANFVLFKAT